MNVLISKKLIENKKNLLIKYCSIFIYYFKFVKPERKRRSYNLTENNFLRIFGDTLYAYICIYI